jgi:uncharacterized sulfatase
MNMRCALIALSLLWLVPFSLKAADQPNILWLSAEDISAHLGCYGYENATTPNLDQLATEGTRYTHAFVTAGVCAPCRSAIITGMYQTSLGTHHMRCNATLPAHVKPFPIWMREAGYYCTNNSKTDYQFKAPKNTWDESSRKGHWKNCPDDKPFFSVFNYTGCHESGIAGDSKYKSVTEGIKKHDRDLVAASLPPYYPNTETTREDWGRYYDIITALDRWVGQHLKTLEEAGLADDTIVVFWSDHGVGLPRAKRWLYDSGMHVLLIVRIPEKYRSGDQGKPGSVSNQLVSLIDLGPTALNLAGAEIPEHMHGQPFLGSNCPTPRKYVYGARDRMDERYDIIRAVRDHRYKYIRNYEPFKTYYQYMNTPESGATMREIRKVQKQGNASAQVAKFLEPEKAIEELYDTKNDPHEMNNLANDPEYKETLDRLKEQHLKWVLETRDLGLVPEAEIQAREKKLGSAWAILNESDNATMFMEQLRLAASTSLAGPDSFSVMNLLLKHPESTFRYWAAIGLGNMGEAGLGAEPQLVHIAINDQSESVRVAAARALCRMERPEEALPVLIDVLDNGSQWARVHAANVLDEIDEQARPAIEGMKRNNAYRKGLVADGKYTVRVLNRALNELEGTDNKVP